MVLEKYNVFVYHRIITSKRKSIKLTKIIEFILILVSLFAITPIVVNAEWKKDNNGWRNTEEKSWAIGWRYIESNWYYFDSNGYMQTGWIHDGAIGTIY